MAGTEAEARTVVRASGRRRAAALVLAIGAGLALVTVGAAAWQLMGAVPVAEVGSPVVIPGGHVTVTEIEHVAPEELGAPLPDGTHAVQIALSVTADPSAPTIVSADDFAISGTAVGPPVAPSHATPQEATVPRGTTISMVLVFAVPDLSTDLVLAVPGGGLATAEHDDHPGDQAR